MPTREQLERSRERNRERFGAESMRRYVAEAVAPSTPEDRRRRRREADAGPRFAPKYDHNGHQVGVHDAWGGPTPPEAA